MNITLRMRRFVPIVAMVAAFATSPASAQGAAINAADVVIAGHSLTNYDMAQMLSEVAASKGVRFSMAVQSLPGHTLWNNWLRCREADWTAESRPRDFACDAIEAGSVNGPYTVFIGTDANDSIASNRIFSYPDVYMEQFMELMLSRNPAARNFLYTSWEALGYAGHDEDWTIEVISELAQYEMIAADAEELSRQRGRNGVVQVLPTNLALRRLILAIEAGSVPGLSTREQIFADAVHPNAIGNYFVACVMFSAIYNQSPEGAATVLRAENGATMVSLSDALALQLQRIAWQAVSEYVHQPVRPAPPTALTVQ